MADYNGSHSVASGGDRIRKRQGSTKKRKIAMEKALLRETKQEKEKERVRVMIDLPHERIGLVPAGQRQSEEWA